MSPPAVAIADYLALPVVATRAVINPAPTEEVGLDSEPGVSRLGPDLTLGVGV